MKEFFQVGKNVEQQNLVSLSRSCFEAVIEYYSHKDLMFHTTYPRAFFKIKKP